MAKHRTHSVAFKRPVSQVYLGGETLHGLAKRHDLSRNLIWVWVEKYQLPPAWRTLTNETLACASRVLRTLG